MSKLPPPPPPAPEVDFHTANAAQLSAKLHDNPVWTENMSYRSGQYRFLAHQEGRIGTVTAAATECEGLNTKGVYVFYELGRTKAYEKFATKVVQTLEEPRPEDVVQSSGEKEVVLKKGDFDDGEAVIMKVRMMKGKSILKTVLSGDTLLGECDVNLTNLLKGKKSSLTGWRDISLPAEDSTTAVIVGRIRLNLTYKPVGEAPDRNDVVCFENFAREKTNAMGTDASLIFANTLHPMVVIDKSENYLYVQYKMRSNNSSNSNNNNDDRYGRIKIHRNSVFVIERLNMVDGLWDMLLKPTDAIMNTAAGEKAKEIAMPTIDYAVNLAKPVYVAQGAKPGEEAWRGARRRAVRTKQRGAKRRVLLHLINYIPQQQVLQQRTDNQDSQSQRKNESQGEQMGCRRADQPGNE